MLVFVHSYKPPTKQPTFLRLFINLLSWFIYFSSARWDIQRIREQRVLQRLQQRMEKKKVTVQEAKPEVSSFYPDPESGTTL